MSKFHQTKTPELPPIIGPAGVVPPNDFLTGKKSTKKAKKNKETTGGNASQPPQTSQIDISTRSKTVIQVISHHTSDSTSPALLLQTSAGHRHFFGRFGEGLQRTMNENRIRFSHLENIFISGPLSWGSVGGLPGMILTLADQGLSKITLQTAIDNLPWACATWRNFIFRGGLDFQLQNTSRTLYFDKYICVKGVAVRPESFSEEEHNARLPEQLEIEQKSYEIFKQIFHNKKNTNDSLDSPKGNRKGSELAAISSVSLPETKHDPRVSCYIIQLRPSRGRFLPKKAIALGVPSGPLFSKLANGETVTTPDGKIVEPKHVLEPPNINDRILVIDCPSNEYVKDLINGHDWRQSLYPESEANKDTSYIDDAEGYTEKVSVAYHILGKSVEPFEGEYFNWLTDPDSKVFTKDCMHFFTHPDYITDGISFDSAALLNMKFRETFPKNFKQLYTADPKKKFPDPATSGYKFFPMLTQGTVALEPQIMYQSNLEKNGGKVDWDALEKDDSTKIVMKKFDEPTVKLIQELESEVEPHLRDIEVVTLGTGSAMPTKFRNVSSTLVSIPGEIPRSILFDCGEATLGNMRRLYGPEGVKERVGQIGILYISHLHADHHLGAISFINTWLEFTEDTPDRSLYVMGPWKYFNFLDEWYQLEPAIKTGRLRFVDNDSVIVGRGFDHIRKTRTDGNLWVRELKQDLGLYAVKTCRAVHCELAYCVTFGFSLEDDKTFTVSYSGDTRPVDFFAKVIGRNSDLLIHEATHENELQHEAIKKKHSTISDALGIAYTMKAKYTVLTHFSQRYPKLPNMDGLDDNAKCNPDTCVHGDEDAITPQSRSPSSDYILNENGKRSPNTPLEPFSLSDSKRISRSRSGSPSSTFSRKSPKPVYIPPGHMPKFALGFDGLHLKLSDIPKQKLRFKELSMLFDEVQATASKEEEELELQE